MKPTKKDIFWVSAQLALFLAYILPVRWLAKEVPSWLRVLGWGGVIFGAGLLLVAVLQLGSTLTPFPSPKTHGRLVTSGTYRLARHPIYAGILWLLGGWALAHGNGYQGWIVQLLLVLFFYKSDYEETLLMEHYSEYAVYRKQVGRFFPWTFRKDRQS